MTNEFNVFVGMDLANSKHDVCIQDVENTKRKFSVLTHSPESIDDWIKKLHGQFKGQIAIAVELTRGPIVYALQKYSFVTIFPINPAMLAQYRKHFLLAEQRMIRLMLNWLWI